MMSDRTFMTLWLIVALAIIAGLPIPLRQMIFVVFNIRALRVWKRQTLRPERILSTTSRERR